MKQIILVNQMAKSVLLLLLFLSASTVASISLAAQNQTKQWHGFVYEEDGQSPLPGASLYLLSENKGALSDSEGHFKITTEIHPQLLVASFVGYKPDTIQLKNQTGAIVFQLKTEQLKEVELIEKQTSSTRSLYEAINVEKISSKELHKAACCNLSESFETNPAVDVSFSDAVSGAKQIQMLGLDGVYTQILSENMPMLRGLSSSYGLNYVPGSWVESIQVGKGVGSVTNGYESLTGQINVELWKPTTSPKFFFNAYASAAGRVETNFIVTDTEGDWRTATLGHVSGVLLENDNNNDKFMDIPKGKQINLLNRWDYRGIDNMHIAFGLRVMHDDKQGGQIEEVFNPYKVDLETRQVEFFSKVGKVFPSKPYKSIALMTSYRFHNQTADFGKSFSITEKTYSGEQNSLYLNFIYQSIIGNTFHKIKMGSSLYVDNYRETYQNNPFNRDDRIYGVFAEYNYTPNERFTTIAGFRTDHYNLFGNFYSPRLYMKFNPSSETVIKGSVGKAFRVPNLFAENIPLMASGRLWDFDIETIEPEEAWNFGLNFGYKFKIGDREGNLQLDLYRTVFQRQLIVDLEQYTQTSFVMSDEGSFANSFQADLTYELFENFQIRIAHKRYQVRAKYGSGWQDVPLTPKYRSMLNLAYATAFDRWTFDATFHNVGPSRAFLWENEYQSPDFTSLNMQVTKKFRYFDAYVGVENIGNYRQDNPILFPEDPNNDRFDASMIWGPVLGRMYYVGLRYSLEQKK